MNLTEEIISNIKRNDRKTITEFYYQCFNVLMSTVARYMKNEEDQKTVVNDSFMKVIKNIHLFDRNAPLEPWIRKIVRNEVIDSYRKGKNYTTFFDFDSEHESSDSIELSNYDIEIENEYLRKLLNSLPPATNLVFNLFAVDGYTNKEICEELGIGYETVKWHIKEARKRLKLILENKSIAS